MAGPVLASAIPMRENTTLKKPQALECIQCPAVEIGTETTSPDIDITGLSSHAVADDTHSTPRPLLPDEQTLNSGGGSSSGNSKRYSPLFIVPPPLTERPSLPRRLYYYSEPYRRGVPLPTDSAHPTPLSMGEADYNENQTTSAANKQAAPNDLSPFLWQTQDEVRMARQRSRIRNGQATAVSSNQHPHICIDGEGHHYTRGTTLCGICCSILFFPCSLLCCVTSSERRCKKCQQHVSQRHYR
ncbi:hypothetical protein BDF19DRAFT_429586 [Syncephalis fuscata]|nr:hypothetical protein BDF19DRAFT_429586 [Syncephalis fuscata]